MVEYIEKQAAIDAINSHFGFNIEEEYGSAVQEVINGLPSAQSGQKSCKTCHLWEDGKINIACPWGSNYEHYEDDYCSLWEKEN